jgi:uncharacterized membrane protein
MIEATSFVEQNGRIRSVDVLRGVALVFMVINHFGQTFVGGGFHSPVAAAILFFGITPAPLFYIVAGVGVVLTNHQMREKGASTEAIWQRVLSRGVLIMGLGYFFSITFFGPIWWLDWSILQLIGFSLIICQIALLIPWRYRLLLPIFFVVLMPFVQVLFNYAVVVGTVGNIQYAPPSTWFEHLSAIIATGKAPIFPWLACPLIGTILGEFFVEHPPTPRRLVYNSLFVGGSLCLLVLPMLLLASDPVTQYPLTLGFFFLSTGMALLAVASVVTTVDVWGWWNLASQFFEVNGQVALISYIAHHFYGITLLGVILGLYRALEVLGLTLIIISYFVLALVFAHFWLPFRKNRTAYWDIAVTYLILFLALFGRWVLAVVGFWTF